MQVLVTGASGFVGGHVCRELLARGRLPFEPRPLGASRPRRA